MHRSLSLGCLLAVATTSSFLQGHTPPDVLWADTFFQVPSGYTFESNPRHIAVDGDTVVIVGQGSQSLDPDPADDEKDAYLLAYSTDGTSLGTHWYGDSDAYDYATSVAPSLDGGWYIGGGTWGDYGSPNNWDGNPFGGFGDAFLTKVDANFQSEWVQQFGGISTDAVYGIAVSSQNKPVITGQYSDTTVGGNDFFVSELTAAGDSNWLSVFGQPAVGSDDNKDDARDIALGQDGISYIVGYGDGDLTGGSSSPVRDAAFITAVDSSGNQLWVDQFYGTDAADSGACANGVASSPTGDIYIVGQVNQNRDDVWIAKYDESGQQLWLKQFADDLPDGVFPGGQRGQDIVVDVNGDLYVAATVNGPNPFDPSIYDPLEDSTEYGLIIKFSSEGDLLWTKEINASELFPDFGVSSSGEDIAALAIDDTGRIYMTGFAGFAGGVSRGAFVAVLESTVIPEPASLALLGLGVLALIRRY